MLTEEEKWSFDLHGYLVLKDAVPKEDVKRMVELCDTWHALDDSELPPPLKSYRDVNTKPTTPRSINNVPYADEVFQRLVLNREIMRAVLALTGSSPQLLSVALVRNTKQSDDIGFHGGFSGGIRNPAPFATPGHCTNSPSLQGRGRGIGQSRPPVGTGGP